MRPRRRDLKGLTRRGEVDPDSNYCFGEGGAGTYSDGKLYTRAHKRGSVRDILEILGRHGAPRGILTEARPHIGSNRLPLVVTSVRTARTATDKVATVNALLSQISVSVWLARLTAESLRCTQAASRCSGVPGPVTLSTSLASAACAV